LGFLPRIACAIQQRHPGSEELSSGGAKKLFVTTIFNGVTLAGLYS
jgi:hypothetical protein